ncbi:MAG: UDP-N-acetylmuramoyl-L-alanyl-D-glutamate--2,6-diaminopimelate ligase [Candidatus Pacebacteria bacterium]|nr:UDP-N-acetylmuramoyl-L-alanyl-D-glutamate--2,6-diaminopimelate ligase [Candidatus Paceibacterota bacterium]
MIKKIIKKSMPRFIIGWYHFLTAFLGALIYGLPSRKIKVIGITGTNGKTTTANLAAATLEAAGHKVAVASSIKFKIGPDEKENKLKMTMPGRAVLQRFLKQAVKARCDYAILECTSEGVLQHRHKFIRFETMVFTNLSPEHIEHHKGFENYKRAKGEYFKACKNIHIINGDNENSGYFLGFTAKAKYVYGFKDAKTDYKTIKAQRIEESKAGLSFEIDGLGFSLPLLGRFNVYNALAAVCVGLSQGVSLEVCQQALSKADGVPGRMEEIISEPFKVIVDYAFTPNALEQVYLALKPQKQSGKLVCLLGACGGGRDKWKRPVLGQIAVKYCDEIIITNEDPYDENPMDIINQVAQGAKGEEGGNLLPARRDVPSFLILDRREAIHKALTLAKPGDTVVITGKGCEPWICEANGKKIPWDDRRIAREELAAVIAG